MYRVSMFSHLSVPKVVFSFSPSIPSILVNSLLSHSSCYFLLPRISRSSFSSSSSSSRWHHSKFFEVTFLHSFFAREHTLINNISNFIFTIYTAKRRLFIPKPQSAISSCIILLLMKFVTWCSLPLLLLLYGVHW